MNETQPEQLLPEILEEQTVPEAEMTARGIGRLSEIIGSKEAREFFDKRDARKKFLYERAVRRWGERSPFSLSRFR
jgi:hypothetical protein